MLTSRVCLERGGEGGLAPGWSHKKMCLYKLCSNQIYCLSCIDGGMITVLSLSAVDRGFECRSGQIKDYEIGIC